MSYIGRTLCLQIKYKAKVGREEGRIKSDLIWNSQ